MKLALGTGGDRVPLAVIEVAATGGPYAYVTVGAEILARGVADLHIELRGTVRLAHVAFSG